MGHAVRAHRCGVFENVTMSICQAGRGILDSEAFREYTIESLAADSGSGFTKIPT